MSDFEDLAEQLNNAQDYTDIFGDDPKTTAASLKDTYRKLARVVHPDANGGDRGPFQILNQLYSDAETTLAEGRFGEPVVLAKITTKRATHVVKKKLGSGDIGFLFRTTTTTTNGEITGFLKVAKNGKNNDLIGAEAKALKKLHAVDDPLTRHYPMLLDTFLHRDGRRSANVVTWQPHCYNLIQMMDLYPGGMDPRHVTWIWRRLLMGLGFAHRQGIIHGAILPPHVLIYPEHHGVILVDWCASSIATPNDPPGILNPIQTYDLFEDNPPIKAVVGAYRSWYPAEVLAKDPPSAATDIVMGARAMIYLLGGNPATGLLSDRVPKAMRAFFKGCLLDKQNMRPQDAWVLLQEFDGVLKRIGEPYHPRRFVELVVPSGIATAAR